MRGERSDADVLLEMVAHHLRVAGTARDRMGFARDPDIRAKWNELAGEYERRAHALQAAVKALVG